MISIRASEHRRAILDWIAPARELGLQYAEIAEQLNAADKLTFTGKRWTKSNLARLICEERQRNPNAD